MIAFLMVFTVEPFSGVRLVQVATADDIAPAGDKTPPADKPNDGPKKPNEIPKKPDVNKPPTIKSDTKGSEPKFSEIDQVLLSFYDPQNNVMPEKEPEVLKIVEKYPKNSRALMMLARLNHAKGQQKTDGKSNFAKYKEAADYMRRAIATAKRKHDYDLYASNIFYDEACAYAQEEDTAETLKALRLAVEYGWTNAAHLKQDSDLAFIRDNKDFASLVKQIEARPKKK